MENNRYTLVVGNDTVAVREIREDGTIELYDHCSPGLRETLTEIERFEGVLIEQDLEGLIVGREKIKDLIVESVVLPGSNDTTVRATVRKI